jgi:hypothetical protein
VKDILRPASGKSVHGQRAVDQRVRWLEIYRLSQLRNLDILSIDR